MRRFAAARALAERARRTLTETVRERGLGARARARRHPLHPRPRRARRLVAHRAMRIEPRSSDGSRGAEVGGAHRREKAKTHERLRAREKRASENRRNRPIETGVLARPTREPVRGANAFRAGRYSGHAQPRARHTPHRRHGRSSTPPRRARRARGAPRFGGVDRSRGPRARVALDGHGRRIAASRSSLPRSASRAAWNVSAHAAAPLLHPQRVARPAASSARLASPATSPRAVACNADRPRARGLFPATVRDDRSSRVCFPGGRRPRGGPARPRRRRGGPRSSPRRRSAPCGRARPVRATRAGTRASRRTRRLPARPRAPAREVPSIAVRDCTSVRRSSVRVVALRQLACPFHERLSPTQTSSHLHLFLTQTQRDARVFRRARGVRRPGAGDQAHHGDPFIDMLETPVTSAPWWPTSCPTCRRTARACPR